MTLTSELNRVEYSPDGNDTSFAVTFVFWDLDDPLLTLRAADGTETAWVRGTQYTMSGGSGSTGTATVITSPTDYTPANGTTLVITSNLAFTQDTDLPVGGPFPSGAVEQQLDQIVRMNQQGSEEDGRRLHYPITDLASLSSEIPNSIDRASKALTFDGSGVPTATTLNSAGDVPVTPFMATVLDDATATDALATLTAPGLALDNTFTGTNLNTAQPAFLVTRDGTSSDKTGNGAAFTIENNAEVFDLGSDYNTSTFTFTAPVTGRYLLSVMVTFSGITAAADSAALRIVTSNRTYLINRINTNDIAATMNLSATIVADMDASDTVSITLTVAGEASDIVDVISTLAIPQTFFSGCLLV